MIVKRSRYRWPAIADEPGSGTARTEDAVLIGTVLVLVQGVCKAQTVAAEACFDKLVDEPAQIPVRVQELKTRAAALATEVGGDVTKLDLDREYARYLVAWHDLADIRLGFTDTNAFYDCVCSALSCALRGRQALGVLTHHIAVEDCKKQAQEDACNLLKDKDNVVNEVVAICHRRCTPKTEGQAGEAGQTYGGGQTYGAGQTGGAG